MIYTDGIIYKYDEAIVQWLLTLKFSESIYGPDFDPDTEAVKVGWSSLSPFFGNPDKAFSSLPDRETNFPVITLDSNNIIQPDLRRRYPGDIRRYDTVTENGITKNKRVRYPSTYQVDYTIEFFTRHSSHMKQLMVPFLLAFDVDILWLTVNLPAPIGRKYMRLRMDNIVDNSVLEQDAPDRYQVFRRTVDLTADILLYEDKYPSLEDRVERFEILFNNNDNTTLDTSIETSNE